MRFRATLASHAFQVLSHLLQCFERLNGSSGAGRGKCAFLLSIETFTIALKERGDELQTFAKLSMERLFMDTILQSRAENRIGFLCDVKLFHKALLSGKNASAVTLRLLKKEGLSYMCLRTRVRNHHTTAMSSMS
jgi:HUS1 checkpoint protein